MRKVKFGKFVLFDDNIHLPDAGWSACDEKRHFYWHIRKLNWYNMFAKQNIRNFGF